MGGGTVLQEDTARCVWLRMCSMCYVVQGGANLGSSRREKSSLDKELAGGT